jgi:hypothetical protein
MNARHFSCHFELLSLLGMILTKAFLTPISIDSDGGWLENLSDFPTFAEKTPNMRYHNRFVIVSMIFEL